MHEEYYLIIECNQDSRHFAEALSAHLFAANINDSLGRQIIKQMNEEDFIDSCWMDDMQKHRDPLPASLLTAANGLAKFSYCLSSIEELHDLPLCSSFALADIEEQPFLKQCCFIAFRFKRPLRDSELETIINKLSCFQAALNWAENHFRLQLSENIKFIDIVQKRLISDIRLSAA